MHYLLYGLHGKVHNSWKVSTICGICYTYFIFSGGVYTPGAAFVDTKLIERLEKNNVKFSVAE